MILSQQLSQIIRHDITRLPRVLLVLASFGLSSFLLMSSETAMAAGERTYPFPQDAVDALVSAAKSNDKEAIQSIFGPDGKDLVSPDAVQASEGYDRFVKRLLEKTQLINHADSSITLEIGLDNWPFPIPLKQFDGKWFFDTAAGKEEILSRRIGMDEIGVINVCHAYVSAQREYASQDRLGDGVFSYAQFLHSSPGIHDGLFWPVEQGQDLSPLGSLVAAARMEGYSHPAKMINDEQAPYHGYYFKILTQQGSHAPGGAYHYLINGRMLSGFALVAWPAEWGNTGIMTFIVNQQGKVYQRNLGPRSGAICKEIISFDPNQSWNPAQ